MPAALEFKDVSKHYPGSEAPAVVDLSLDVEPGETCVLVGPSGSGKTTAMRMVNRMVDITSGDILLDGRSILESDPSELRRHIGYVIQHVGLFPHRTVAQNIGTVPQLLGWPKARIEERSRELLGLVGLEPEIAKRYPAYLSGGQRQRVGVARALAADPPLMLMDEPFGALDPITRDRLQGEFERLKERVSTTIVFVTHDIDEAIRLGDRIAILRQGGVLAQYATPAELLLHPADDVRRGVRRRRPRAQAPRARHRGRRRARAGPGARHERDALAADVAARRARRAAPGPRRPPVGRRRRRPGPRDADRRGHPRQAAARGRRALPRLMLAQVEIRDRSGDASCVADNGFCPEWIADNLDRYWDPFVQHVFLVVVSVAIGFAIASTLALLAYRRRWLITPVVNFTGILYTIPSVAAFFLLLPLTGRGDDTAIIALVAYTLLILFRNMIDGLQSVPEDARDAGRGMGLTQRQLLWQVEIPLALPAIMAGLRVATTTTVGLAALAFFAGAGGLGAVINADLAFKSNVVVASLLCVLLAAVLDGIILLVQRALTPWTRTATA